MNEYLADLQAGTEELNTVAPQTEEERQEIFRLKKRGVDTLVKRITIDRARELSVEIRLNLLDIIEEEPQSSAIHLGKAGIYTSKRSSPARHRHHVICESPSRPAYQFVWFPDPHRSVEL